MAGREKILLPLFSIASLSIGEDTERFAPRGMSDRVNGLLDVGIEGKAKREFDLVAGKDIPGEGEG